MTFCHVVPKSALLQIPPLLKDSPAKTVAGDFGSTATELVEIDPPVPLRAQLSPPLIVLKTGPPPPAYNVDGVTGSIAKLKTSPVVIPVLRRLQVAPLSVLLKTPLLRRPKLSVPAYTVAGFKGSITIARTEVFDRPLFIGVQFFPPSVLLKTPRSVPA